MGPKRGNVEKGNEIRTRGFALYAGLLSTFGWHHLRNHTKH